MPTGSTLGLKAKLGVETDDRQVDRETEDLKSKVSEAAEAEMTTDVSTLKQDITEAIEESVDSAKWMPDIEESQSPEVMFDDASRQRLSQQMGALGQPMHASRMGGTPGPAGQSGGIGGEILAGMKGAGGKFLKVGLAGAVGFGILSQLSKLGDAAPRLGKTMRMLYRSVQLFARPFLDVLAKFIEGPTEALLQMGANFNKIYNEKGLKVAIVEGAKDMAQDPEASGGILGGIAGYVGGKKISQRLFSGFLGKRLGGPLGMILGFGAGGKIGKNVGELLGGDFSPDNILSGGLVAGGGYLGAKKLQGLFSGGLGGLLGRQGGKGILKRGLSSAVGGPAGLAAWLGLEGGIELSQIAGGGDGFDIVNDFGQWFDNKWPNLGDSIENAFTSDDNPFYSLGKKIGNEWEGWDSLINWADLDIKWKGWDSLVNWMDLGIEWKGWDSLVGWANIDVPAFPGWDDLVDLNPNDGNMLGGGDWGLDGDLFGGGDWGFGGGYIGGSDGSIDWESMTPEQRRKLAEIIPGLEVPEGMASGGVVTGPTNALIGEGSEDEAVVPLSDLENMLSREWERGARMSGQRSESIEGSGEDIVDRLDEVIKYLRRLDPGVELQIDRETLAKEGQKGKQRYSNSQIVSR